MYDSLFWSLGQCVQSGFQISWIASLRSQRRMGIRKVCAISSSLRGALLRSNPVCFTSLPFDGGW